MKFKGDVIITDPCYIMNDKKKYWKHPTYPKWKDYHKDFNGNVIENYNEFYNSSESDKILEIRKALFDTNYEIMREAEILWKQKNPNLIKDDWELSKYGENMEILGFKNYLTSDTGYGDWNCTTFNSDNKNKLGSFCADGGMVSVFLLDEVLKYNPDFDYHIKRPWTTTLIKDFEGDIWFENFDYEYEDEETGEVEYVDELRVVGKGNVNFYTTQTGF